MIYLVTIYQMFLIFINKNSNKFYLQMLYFSFNNLRQKVALTSFIQKQPFGVLLSKKCSETFPKFTGKYPCKSPFLIKLQAQRLQPY